MKYINGLFVTVLSVLAFALISGCAPAVQIGASLGGDLAADMLKKSDIRGYDHRWLREGKEIERHKIGGYEVLVSDGRADDEDYIFFSAYDYKKLNDPKLRVTKRVELRKDNKEDMQIYGEYSKTETINKQKFIKELFIKIKNFDLGPIEEAMSK